MWREYRPPTRSLALPVVTHDVKDHALVIGVPAGRRAGSAMAESDLPLNGDGEATCPATGETYLLSGGQCRLEAS